MDQQKIIKSHSGDVENSSNNNNNNNNSNNNVGLLQWTNERHSNFLRVMEASFVRNMLKRSNNTSNNHTITNHHHKSSKLDRFVPDISESTLDLQRSDRVSRSCNRQKERPTIHPYKISHDQVVPELENKSGDEKK